MNQKRPTRRSRRSSQQWSSSVIGTHASSGRPSARRGASRRDAYESRRRSTSLQGRTAELSQMRPTGATINERGTRRRPADPGELIRQKRRGFFVRAGIIGVIALIIAFALGSFAFQASVSGNLSLKDSTVASALTTPETDTEPYYILVGGLAKDSTKASYLALLRVDPESGALTLLNVPANIASGKGSLRDLPGREGEGALVSAVAEKTGIDIAHYIRITDTGIADLVDALGGIEVEVAQTVDDPRVSSTVIDAGRQTLTGDEVLTYVEAYNYVDGRTTRASVQAQVLNAVITKLASKSGLEFMQAADVLANNAESDMGYDDLAKLAEVYTNCSDILYGTIPGTDVSSGNRTYFRIATTNWEQVREKFLAGEEPVVTYDTDDVNKKKLSIVVLNGSGISGYASKVEKALVDAGYTVKETGNAESYVYDETLVVYRTSDDLAAAEAIVDDIGCGRAVSAGVNYALTTDIQIMVGKDWVS